MLEVFFYCSSPENDSYHIKKSKIKKNTFLTYRPSSKMRLKLETRLFFRPYDKIEMEMEEDNIDIEMEFLWRHSARSGKRHLWIVVHFLRHKQANSHLEFFEKYWLVKIVIIA